jgi:AcrR family transcriptional regulator
VTRRYTLGRRRVQAEATRERIVAAARTLLGTPDGARAMTIDAVAREAGVTRATVYQQMESKPRLLAAVLDDLARERGLDRIGTVLGAPDPTEALDGLVDPFVRFWAADRELHRHLSGLMEIDPSLREALRERQGRRRRSIAAVAKRIDPSLAQSTRRLADVVDAIVALLSPAMLERLAPRRSTAQVAAIVRRLARAAIPER